MRDQFNAISTLRIHDLVPRGWTICIFVVVALLLTACIEPMENYEHPAEPRFEGQYAPPTPEIGDNIKVVSWNIKFSQQVDEATVELAETPELRDADILLLQEMDEVGTQQIAENLHYNYIYYRHQQ